MVVDGKFWRGTAALLESVGAREPHINEMREYIRRHIRQAVIPLVAYAKQYEPHQALINLVTTEYIRYSCIVKIKMYFLFLVSLAQLKRQLLK